MSIAPAVQDLMEQTWSAVKVATGLGHACALTSDGLVVCWGDSTVGQCGRDNSAQGYSAITGDFPMDRADAIFFKTTVGEPVDLVAGDLHSCIRTAEGTVVCWGRGADGRLGQNSENNIGTDLGGGVRVRNTDPIVFPDGNPAIIDVSAGARHTCVVTELGHVMCFGDNNKAQLGYSTVQVRSVGSGKGTAGHHDILDLQNVTFSTVEAELGAEARVASVSCGYDHTCVLFDASTSPSGNATTCFGSRRNGAIAQMLAASTVTFIAAPAAKLVPQLPHRSSRDAVIAVVAGGGDLGGGVQIGRTCWLVGTGGIASQFWCAGEDQAAYGWTGNYRAALAPGPIYGDDAGDFDESAPQSAVARFTVGAPAAVAVYPAAFPCDQPTTLELTHTPESDALELFLNISLTSAPLLPVVALNRTSSVAATVLIAPSCSGTTPLPPRGGVLDIAVSQALLGASTVNGVVAGGWAANAVIYTSPRVANIAPWGGSSTAGGVFITVTATGVDLNVIQAQGWSNLACCFAELGVTPATQISGSPSDVTCKTVGIAASLAPSYHGVAVPVSLSLNGGLHCGPTDASIHYLHPASVTARLWRRYSRALDPQPVVHAVSIAGLPAFFDLPPGQSSNVSWVIGFSSNKTAVKLTRSSVQGTPSESQYTFQLPPANLALWTASILLRPLVLSFDAGINFFGVSPIDAADPSSVGMRVHGAINVATVAPTGVPRTGTVASGLLVVLTMSGDFPAHCLTCLVCSSGCIAPVVRFNHTTDGTIFLAGTVVAPASGGALVAAASGSVPAAVSASVQFTRASGNTPMTISVLVPAFAAPGAAALAISLDGGATFYSGPQAGLLLFEPLTVFPPAGPVGAVTSVTVAGTAFFDAGAAMVGRFGAAGDVPCKFKAGAVLCLGPLAEGTAVANMTAPKTVAVEVSASNGVAFSAGGRALYEFFDEPTLTAVVPAFVPSDAAERGLTVTVHGTGFPIVAVSGAAIAPICSLLSSSFEYVTSLPGSNPQNGSVVCKCPSGFGSAQIGLSFNAGANYGTSVAKIVYLVIASVTPIRVPETGGSEVEISGAGFPDAASGEVMQCAFTYLGGGDPVSNVTSTGAGAGAGTGSGSTAAAPVAATTAVVVGTVFVVPATMETSVLVSCTTPAGAFPRGDYAVSLGIESLPGFRSNFADQLTAYAAPAVTAVSPKGGAASGGTRITVYGTNIGNYSSLVRCRVGLSKTEPAAGPNGEIVCVSPGGNKPLEVELSLNEGFDYSASAPDVFFTPISIQSISPTHGSGKGGTEVVVLTSGIPQGPGFSNDLVLCRWSLRSDLGTTPISIDDGDSGAATTTAAAAAAIHSGVLSVTFPADRVIDKRRAICRSPSSLLGGLLDLALSVNGGVDFAVLGDSDGDGLSDPPISASSSTTSANSTAATSTSTSASASTATTGSSVVATAQAAGTGFAVYAQPIVRSLSPALGPAIGGTVVTFSGDRFPAIGSPECSFGVGTVRVSGVARSSTVECISPPGSGVASIGIVFNGVDTVSIAVVQPTPPASDGAVSRRAGDHIALTENGDHQQAAKSGSTSSTVVVSSWSVLSVSGDLLNTVGLANTDVVRGGMVALPSESTPSLVRRQHAPGFSVRQAPATTGGGFFYYDVVTVSPRWGPAVGGTAVRVSGSGFLPQYEFVCRFGTGSTVSRAVWISEALVECTAPPASTAPPVVPALTSASDPIAGMSTEVPIEISALAVGSSMTSAIGFAAGTSSVARFRYYSTPIVTSVSPGSGPTAGGTLVTVRGSGFLPIAALACRFGADATATVAATFVSTFELTCNTTAHPLANTTVYVSNNRVDYVPQPAAAAVFSFSQCAAGTFAGSHTDPCLPCPAGFIASATGVQECTRCSATEYTAGEGASACLECPANTAVASGVSDSLTACACKDGFYDPTEAGGGVACLACPEGGICAGGNAAPIAQPGYWYDGTAVGAFLKCDGTTQCPGGTALTCGEGHSGRVCSICDPGWYKLRSECRACPDHAIFFLIGLVVFCIVICVVLLKVVGAKNAHQYGGTIAAAVDFFQVLAIIGDIPLNWPPAVSRAISIVTAPFYLSLEIVASECSVPDIGYPTLWVAMNLLPVFFALILAGIFVCAALHSAIVHATGVAVTPVSDSDELDGAAARDVDDDDSDDNSSDADANMSGDDNGARSIDNDDKGATKGTVVGQKPSRVSRFRRWLATPVALRPLADTLLNTSLLMLQLSYLLLLTSALQLFQCTSRADGTSTLDASPGLNCYDPWWWRLMPAGVAAGVGYGLGVPLCFVAILRIHAGRLRHPVTVRRFSSVYFEYARGRELWGAAVLGEKMAIAVAGAFLGSWVVLQVAVLLAVLMTVLIAGGRLRPMAEERNNSLEYFLRLCMCVVLLCGLLFHNAAFPLAWFEGFVTYAVLVIIALAIVAVVWVVCSDLLYTFNQERKSIPADLARLLDRVFCPNGSDLATEMVRSVETDPKIVPILERTLRRIAAAGEAEDAFADSNLPLGVRGLGCDERMLDRHTLYALTPVVLPSTVRWLTRVTREAAICAQEASAAGKKKGLAARDPSAAGLRAVAAVVEFHQAFAALAVYERLSANVNTALPRRQPRPVPVSHIATMRLVEDRSQFPMHNGSGDDFSDSGPLQASPLLAYNSATAGDAPPPWAEPVLRLVLGLDGVLPAALAGPLWRTTGTADAEVDDDDDEASPDIDNNKGKGKKTKRPGRSKRYKCPDNDNWYLCSSSDAAVVFAAHTVRALSAAVGPSDQFLDNSIGGGHVPTAAGSGGQAEGAAVGATASTAATAAANDGDVVHAVDTAWHSAAEGSFANLVAALSGDNGQGDNDPDTSGKSARRAVTAAGGRRGSTDSASSDNIYGIAREDEEPGLCVVS
eukprot:TRINITY_DN1941_c0_g1_i1.p1 TRINITY_DN1941_c0_g1~~TRINITY_DN1941_c0_g1_i1.p1  ORF type:complete len:2874 (-),score=743.10 TRINITY_DN1941_c0_g1_i1:38-8659(-)